MKVHISIHHVWWLKTLYLPGIVLMCALGITPDWELVDRTIQRGLRVTIKWESEE